MNPAFLRPAPVADPVARLVVFPHAGGSGSAYYPLVHKVPADWELLLLDLPGRGRQHRLAPLTDMAAVVKRATADVLDHADVPLALFGHSFGAVVAVETARELQARGARVGWVGVSGRPAPGHRGGRVLDHDVADIDLLRQLRALGGMPDQIHRVPGFRDQVLRLIRGDLRVLDTYVPPRGRAGLSAPLTAFGGVDDPWAPPISLAGWAAETSAEFRQRLFPGGHFHFLGTGFPDFAGAVLSEAVHAFHPNLTRRL
ncbi:thioesterase II family protein [Micromonospora sp. CA-259024]|uniref:thioesterase II family protein n=1 Tax=Micromonospora sp. CA-259024 TaxID=3239965 RepID=UPI003D8A95C6